MTHHHLTALDSYLQDTGALYLSELLDEILYVLLLYVSDNPDHGIEAAEHFYHLRMLRDLFKTAGPKS